MSFQPCICSIFRETALATTEVYDRALAPCSLKITMFRLLRRLQKIDKTTISEFAPIVNLDRSTLGRNLKILERKGYVRLVCGSDERSKIIHLTEKGEQAIKQATPHWEEAQKQIHSILDEDTQKLLAKLTIFNENCQKLLK